MEIHRLQAMYNDNELAKAVFDNFSERSRTSRQTSQKQIQTIALEATIPCNKAQATQLLKDLADIGCGRYVVGRRGHASRILWHYRLKDLAQVAKGYEDELAALVEVADDEDIDRTVTMIEHTFNLRVDLAVHFELPANLTRTEATRIAGFINTLVIEPS